MARTKKTALLAVWGTAKATVTPVVVWGLQVAKKPGACQEKGKKGTEFAQLIKKLGNPQRLVWGELLDGGEGFQATYQMPGEPEVVMELKKKGSKLVLK